MEKYNFDEIVDRRKSDAMKYRELQSRFGNEDLLPMWIADMDFKVCPEICEGLAHRIAHPVYGYATVPESFYRSIISWVKRRHRLDIGLDEITYVPGVVKGIALAINKFTSEGDGIVIQPPVYHPFKMVIEGNRRKVVNNPLKRFDDRYEMDLDQLKQVIELEKPKMMILCNPHNPVGIQWPAEILRQVADICASAGMIVVSDEIHGDLMLGHRPHIPFLSVNENAKRIGIMLGAPSKTFNIPGLVSSWCVIKNPTLREEFFSWLTSNEFNDPTFFATLATEIAYNNAEGWLEQALDYIQGNIEYIAKTLPEMTGGKIKAYMPEASFLVWLDCRSLGLKQAGLINLFIDKAGLALNDGTMFGQEGEGFMRINVASPRAIVEEAVTRIANAVKTL